MAAVGTPDVRGQGVLYTGVAGVSDNDIVIQTGNINQYDTFMLKTDAGAVDVFVDLGDGTFVGPISLADLGATGTAPVIVTAAGRLYGFSGSFDAILVRQNGGTGATGSLLRAWRQE